MLNKLNISFANMVNIVSLMGGQLKKEQTISGHMADIFSNIYLGHAIVYSFERNNLDKRTRDICLKMLNNETLDAIEKVKTLVPSHLKVLLFGHINTKKNEISTEEIDYLSQVVWKNKELNKYVENQIVVEDNILEKIKRCNENYDESLVNDIVQVGEYNLK